MLQVPGDGVCQGGSVDVDADETPRIFIRRPFVETISMRLAHHVASVAHIVRAFRKFCSRIKLKQQGVEFPSFPEIQELDGEVVFTSPRALLEKLLACELPITSNHIYDVCERIGACQVETIGQLAAGLLIWPE